jgi:hypothetical protein
MGLTLGMLGHSPFFELVQGALPPVYGDASVRSIRTGLCYGRGLGCLSMGFVFVLLLLLFGRGCDAGPGVVDLGLRNLPPCVMRH